MNKRWLIIGIILLVLIGGGVWLATKGDNNKSNSTASQSTGQQTSTTSGFDAKSTEGQPFVATISTDGQQVSTIQSDGKGVTSYTATSNGNEIKAVYTTDTYYVCSGGTCYKYKTGASSPVSFNPSDYTYTSEKLSGYKNNATYKGQQGCPAGKCDVWSVTNSGVTSSIFIDASSKRISQVESTVNGKTTKVVYEFKAVSIDIPTNAQSLPSQ